MASNLISSVSEKWSSATSSAGDWLREQVWFQQIKGKWDELDPQNRLYIQIATAAGIVGTLSLLLLAAYLNVRTIRSEVSEKRGLLTLLQTSSEELRSLRESRPGSSAEASGPWAAYFQSLGAPMGLEGATLTVSSENPGAQSELAKEALLDLTLKKVSIRQVIRFAHAIESGARPVKLRQLLIDTKADPEGYMDATLSVSAFTWVTQQ